MARRIEYVALSYCWGGDQVDKMTRARFQGMSGITAFLDLPTTLQDAIRVTNKLGYRYLWVDSLCITQDDDADKAQEIAKMPSIYSNAIVTIAAATASFALEGFLGKRKTNSPVIDDLQVEDASGQVFTRGIMGLDGSEDADLPLHAWAWALQEALFSTRVLEYRPL